MSNQILLICDRTRALNLCRQNVGNFKAGVNFEEITVFWFKVHCTMPYIDKINDNSKMITIICTYSMTSDPVFPYKNLICLHFSLCFFMNIQVCNSINTDIRRTISWMNAISKKISIHPERAFWRLHLWSDPGKNNICLGHPVFLVFSFGDEVTKI